MRVPVLHMYILDAGACICRLSMLGLVFAGVFMCTLCWCQYVYMDIVGAVHPCFNMNFVSRDACFWICTSSVLVPVFVHEHCQCWCLSLYMNIVSAGARVCT